MFDASDKIINIILDRKKPDQRSIVAVAGAPGAGKTTIAGELCDVLNHRETGSAEILAMDGFHLDNSVLKARGILNKKGAPETFDVDGFAATLERVRNSNQDVAIPVFDRQMDLARAGASGIGSATKIVIVEGNYLLLERPQWARSAAHYDLTVLIEVPMSILEDRLISRWISYGLEPIAARARAHQNDLLNAKVVARQSRPADIVVRLSNKRRNEGKETASADRMV